MDKLARRIVADRTGGRFWAEPPSCTRPVLICAGSGHDRDRLRILARLLERLVASRPTQDLMLVAPGPYGAAARVARRYGIAHLHEPVDPHRLLDGAHEIHELGQGEIGDLAALRGLTVTRYACPDQGNRVEGQQVARRLIEDWQYHDPYTGKITTVGHILAFQALWRRTIDANHQIGACVGMALWKRGRMAEFFSVPPTHPPFVRKTRPAVQRCVPHGKAIVAWATRMPAGLMTEARKAHVPVWRVEDGFVRSVGLGSGLQVPASIFVDQRGIYYDPSEPSDLEHILATTTFDDHLRVRAHALIEHLVQRGISKYGRSETHHLRDWHAQGQRVLLVPGQVSDDLSVLKGGGRIRGNLELLQAVRQHNSDSFIIYRPHPDVTAGHRAGHLSDEVILTYADYISTGGSITDLMQEVDEIHTLTSLAGFEGLLRRRKVVTYGCPFYAGWGMTTDMGPVPAGRRGRSLTLEELVAGTLILYPRYIDPLTHIPCEIEMVIERFGDHRAWRPTALMRLKAIQGRMRNMILRNRTAVEPDMARVPDL
ncbi:beta-3-deoxy-D-manno-oct-2-ulosonic acid transferase [Komagataeibacter sp. FXV3]|nr:beta-3-deoxy-D-manno-oct-2-ulosonic acid transferase [Komagataeibacter sp. FXV3]MBE7730087.1 beta-3-deoxy-D-manno-oct-2-ulosonic acid transferase [Komagataeibacter sp. FXV3]